MARRRRGGWRLIPHFSSPWEMRNLVAAWASNTGSFGPGRHLIEEEGQIFTNLSKRDLAALARSADIRLPDYLSLPDDDEQLIETLAAYGLPAPRPPRQRKAVSA